MALLTHHLTNAVSPGCLLLMLLPAAATAAAYCCRLLPRVWFPPQVDETASDTATPRSLAAGTDGGQGSSIVPLLDKKAGIRDAGLIFAPGKSWVMGLVLVIISGLVLAVTLLTALLD
jgi:hypothetical protein